MKVKNISTRLHHIGAVMVIPGETETVGDEYAGSINRAELEVVEAPATKPAAAAKTAGKGNTAPQTPAAPVAAPQAPQEPSVAAPAAWAIPKPDGAQ